MPPLTADRSRSSIIDEHTRECLEAGGAIDSVGMPRERAKVDDARQRTVTRE